MAGFMKNAMQYLGMADVAEDDEPMDIQDEDPTHCRLCAAQDPGSHWNRWTGQQ